ncbi:MAG: CBS and ACT domain-containing protein [Desulfobacterota bacterium]|nr:CBS and ACT domain-containing protein [Thermodesulfobacteriota bacterium]
MKIKKRMAHKLITIPPQAKVLDALNLLHQHSIRHLPVVDGETFVGFITEAEIRQVLLLPGGSDITVAEVMNKNPVTIGPEENLEEAARLIYHYKLSGIPVVDHGKLVGIITVGDILAAFIEIMGVLQASSRIDVVLGEQPEAFEKVSRIIKQKGGEIISVGMGNMPEKKKKFYFFRLKKCAVDPIAHALREHGYEVVSVIA